MWYGVWTNKEWLSEDFDFSMSKKLDIEPSNEEALTTILHRKTNKSKWVTDKPFMPSKNNMSIEWDEPKLSPSGDPYDISINPFERKWLKHQEVSSQRFNLYSASEYDLWASI